MMDTLMRELNDPRHATGRRSVIPPAGCIIYERTGRWAVALLPRLRERGIHCTETRNLDDCWAAIREAPASAVLVELRRDNLEEVLELLIRTDRHLSRACSLVLGARGLEACEWTVRECGARHFTTSSRELGPVVDIVVRHLDKQPPPRTNLMERIWASLPWDR